MTNRLGRFEKGLEGKNPSDTVHFCIDELVDADGSVNPKTEFAVGNYDKIKGVADQVEYESGSSYIMVHVYDSLKRRHGFARLYASDRQKTDGLEAHFRDLKEQLMTYISPDLSPADFSRTETVYMRLASLDGMPTTEIGIGDYRELKEIASGYEPECQSASQFIMFRVSDEENRRYGFVKVFYQGQITDDVISHFRLSRDQLINDMAMQNPGAQLSTPKVTCHGPGDEEAKTVLMALASEREMVMYR
jgi:hypothetical protein